MEKWLNVMVIIFPAKYALRLVGIIFLLKFTSGVKSAGKNVIRYAKNSVNRLTRLHGKKSVFITACPVYLIFSSQNLWKVKLYIKPSSMWKASSVIRGQM